jgi:hypothetical protein
MKNMFRLVALVVGLVTLSPLAVAARDRQARGALFIRSAVEHGDGTVTLPLHRGTSRGHTVWFVVLDASDGKLATALGVNTSPKLVNARGTRAVQIVQVVDGVIDFPATVDFSPRRQVVPGPLGFPPDVAEPGAVGHTPTATGQGGYSPLIQLPDGTIVNAPHLANDTGQADKVVHLDVAGGTVTYLETEGFQAARRSTTSRRIHRIPSRLRSRT